jgi:hypothetical protein
MLLFDGADLDLVEAARRLLAVAGDEGDGGAVRKKAQDGGDARPWQGEILGKTLLRFHETGPWPTMAGNMRRNS